MTIQPTAIIRGQPASLGGGTFRSKGLVLCTRENEKYPKVPPDREGGFTDQECAPAKGPRLREKYFNIITPLQIGIGAPSRTAVLKP